jgi:glucose-6-phosphate 1-dehydrogenase
MPTETHIVPAVAARVSPQPERKPEPCVVVIFGASGDLTKRKLLPALYHLEQANLLPGNFAVVGVARRPLESSFAPDMKEGIIAGGGVDESDPKLAPLIDKLQYHAMNVDDAGGYDALNKLLTKIDKKFGTCGNRLFYLATAPEYFSDIINFLGQHGMSKPCQDGSVDGRKNWVRTIIEKPFGHDLESARAHNDEVNKVFDDDQIFRIDH